MSDRGPGAAMLAWPIAVAAGVAVAAGLGWGSVAQALAGAEHAVGRLGAAWTPVGPYLAPNLLRAAGAIGLCLVLLAVSDAIGGWCFGLMVGTRSASCLRWTVPLTGYAVISLGVLGIAATGLCYLRFVIGAAAVALVAASPGVGRAVAGTLHRGRELVREAPGLAVCLAVVCILELPRLVLPEHNEDCLMYHLALPQQLLVRHRLPGPPSYWAWSFPLLSDFPNVIAVGLGIDAAARLIQASLMWMGAAACLGVVAGVVRGGWAALLALAALLVPAGSWFFLTAKNDMASCGYALAAVAILMEAGGWRTGRVRWGLIGWGAWTFGCAVAVKYTLGPLAVVGLAVLVPWRWPGIWRRSASLVAALALPVVPWLVGSWIQYADPVHPQGAMALPGVFGIPGTGELLRGVPGEEPGFWAKLGTTGVSLGLLAARSGWLAVAGLPIWLLLRDRGVARAAATALLGAWLMMAVAPGGQTHMGRFAFPAVVLLNVIGLAGFPRMAHLVVPPGSWWRRRGVTAGMAAALAAAAVVLACRIHPYVTWREDAIDVRGRDYLAGRLDAEGYRRSLMGSFGLIQPALAAAVATDPGGRVLLPGGKFLWGIPAPALMVGVGIPPVWDAVRTTPTPDRLAIRFRQMGARWILYDSDIGAWDRTHPAVCRWTPAMLRRYADYGKTRFRTVASTVCEGPGFGQHWLIELDRRAHPATARIPVLPGADAAFADATVAGLRGQRGLALAGFRELYRLLPDVTAARASLGHALVQTGRYREGYSHVRAAVEDGLANCTEPSPLNWAVAALQTGRLKEAVSVYRRALAIYRRWPTVPIEALQRLL